MKKEVLKKRFYKKLQNKILKIKNKERRYKWDWTLMWFYLHKSIWTKVIMDIPNKKISNSINIFLKLERKWIDKKR